MLIICKLFKLFIIKSYLYMYILYIHYNVINNIELKILSQLNYYIILYDIMLYFL